MAQGRFLFVSDLHLDASSPRAIAQFRHFLQTRARDAEALYILGDLFETWIGDDDDEPARSEVCDALRALTGAGTTCHVMHGNRDFLLGSGFEQRTGCRMLPDPVLLETGGLRIVLSHGDLLCTGDAAYQQFRALVRSRNFQAGYLALPLATRRAAARAARSGSRQHIRQMREEIMDVEPEAVASLLRISGASLLIHGHTHRPGVHRLSVDDQPCTRIVLGDWYESGSYLGVNEAGHYELQPLGSPE